MKAEDIVAKISAIGGTIRVTTKGTLAIGPPAAGIPPDLLADIRRNKPELLALLGAEILPPPPATPAIDLRKRRDVIAEQPNPPAYVAWLYAKDCPATDPQGKELQ
jgi:hypothetical protein